MPSRVSPSLREYSLEQLEALLQEIKSAIADREAMPAITPPLPLSAPPPQPPQPPQPPEPQEPPQPLQPPQPAQAAEIRYMHPANRNMAWSGEGPQPEWIDAYLAQGGSWIALRNTAEKLAPRKR